MEPLQKFALVIFIILVILLEYQSRKDKISTDGVETFNSIMLGVILGSFFISASLLYSWLAEYSLIDTLLLKIPQKGLMLGVLSGYFLIYSTISSLLKQLVYKLKSNT